MFWCAFLSLFFILPATNNDIHTLLAPPPPVKFSPDGEQTLGDVRNMIHKLYSSMNVDKHQVKGHYIQSILCG